MNRSTYGEDLFEKYLLAQGVNFAREPELPGVSQRIDFVLDHAVHGKILLEVKDIENFPADGFGAFDPYKPIRRHIEEGTRKFKSTSDYICALVLVAAPGSFVELHAPQIVLGSMYGDWGFRVPFNPSSGGWDGSAMTSEFLVGRGKMVHPSGLRNTRMCAIITVHQFHLWHYAMRQYLHRDDGRTERERLNSIYAGTAGLPDESATEIGVTVWENAAARRKLPRELFRGSMDAWWEYSDEGQTLGFVGDKRRALDIDKAR